MKYKSQLVGERHAKIRNNLSPVNNYSILNQTLLIDAYQQVLNLQVSLINELLLNEKLVNHFILRNKTSDIKMGYKSTDVGTDKISPSFYNKSGSESQNVSSFKFERDRQVAVQINKKHKKTKKIDKKSLSGSCYTPSSENSQKIRQKSIRQTKHIPKNYGKSIINFMLKNHKLLEKLCQIQGEDFKELRKVVQSFKGKIYNVSNLKSMWLQQGNKFAKIFRIASMLYLRKYSLQHIFNSRVQNYKRHIKYRYRIIQAVRDPSSFSRIKEY